MPVNFIRTLCFAIVAGFCTLLLPIPASAQSLAPPAGEVVLTIDGTITVTNAEGRADFDMDMLRAMPTATFKTATPWTDAPAEFEGVPLDHLMKVIGAKGATIQAAALNDYIARVDVATLQNSGAILAYKVNGAEISVRDKGPLWIMFPFDQKPDLKAEVIYSQSVWQLRKMTFQE